VAVALTALLAVAVVVPLMVFAASSGGGSHRPPAARNSTPAGGAVATDLPIASGRTAAAAKPAIIGSDPRLLHFTFDITTLPALDSLIWRSVPGREVVEAAYGEGASVSLTLYRRQSDIEVFDPHTRMRSSRTIDVNGRPATLQKFGAIPGTPTPSWALYWQPIPGAFAAMNAADATDEAMLAVAASVSLAKTYFCAQPLRVTVSPPGATLMGCATGLAGPGRARPGLGAWLHSALEYQAANGPSIEVLLRPYLPLVTGRAPEDVPANTTVAGQPAHWDPKESALRVYPYDRVFDLAVSGLSQADAEAVAGGLRIADDLSDPSAWV